MILILQKILQKIFLFSNAHFRLTKIIIKEKPKPSYKILRN